MLCAKFDWNWTSGSGEEDFYKFLLFRNYLHLEKGGALHLNKLESPSPKDALCQVWLKLAQWFWRRWKCEKFTDGRTDRRTERQTTDDRWSEKLTGAFSSGEFEIVECRAYYQQVFTTSVSFANRTGVPLLINSPDWAFTDWKVVFFDGLKSAHKLLCARVSVSTSLHIKAPFCRLSAAFRKFCFGGSSLTGMPRNCRTGFNDPACWTLSDACNLQNWHTCY